VKSPRDRHLLGALDELDSASKHVKENIGHVYKAEKYGTGYWEELERGQEEAEMEEDGDLSK
jgi:hypothetical protein